MSITSFYHHSDPFGTQDFQNAGMQKFIMLEKIITASWFWSWFVASTGNDMTTGNDEWATGS